MRYILIESIVSISKRLYKKGFMEGGDGNVSAFDGKYVYITPSGLNKGYLEPSHIITVDIDGNLANISEFKPSSELPMHLAFYMSGKNIRYVIHTHPFFTVLYSFFDFLPLGEYLKELKLVLDEVLITKDISVPQDGSLNASLVLELLKSYKKDYGAIILKHHGLVVFGSDIEFLANLTEKIEFASRFCIEYEKLKKELNKGL